MRTGEQEQPLPTFPEVDLKGQKVSVYFFLDQMFERHQELDRLFQWIFYLETQVQDRRNQSSSGPVQLPAHIDVNVSLTLTSLSGISSSLGPPISSSSSSFFFFWFFSCFSFSAFFFSSSSWAFFCALLCLFLSFFSSLSERLAGGQREDVSTVPLPPVPSTLPHPCQPVVLCCRRSEGCRGDSGTSGWP